MEELLALKCRLRRLLNVASFIGICATFPFLYVMRLLGINGHTGNTLRTNAAGMSRNTVAAPSPAVVEEILEPLRLRCGRGWTERISYVRREERRNVPTKWNDSSVELSDLKIATLTAMSLLSSMQIPTDVEHQKMQMARRMQRAALEGQLKAKHSARSTRRLMHIVRQTMASY